MLMYGKFQRKDLYDKQHTLTYFMKLSKKEEAVINFLHQHKISTKKHMCLRFDISHMTVVRALQKYGYFTSYNKNSAFYTLSDIPKFDKNGLWSYNSIFFSRYITLEKTIINLVNNSSSGFTVNELNKIVHTEAKNIVSRLCKHRRISKRYFGRYAVFMSADNQRMSEQEKHRRKQTKTTQPTLIQKRKECNVPENVDPLTVIKILVQMIEFPQAKEISISMSLQHQGIAITVKDVRDVIRFYGLEKKMGALR